MLIFFRELPPTPTHRKSLLPALVDPPTTSLPALPKSLGSGIIQVTAEVEPEPKVKTAEQEVKTAEQEVKTTEQEVKTTEQEVKTAEQK